MKTGGRKNIYFVKHVESVLNSDLKSCVLPLHRGIITDVKRTHIYPCFYPSVSAHDFDDLN